MQQFRDKLKTMKNRIIYHQRTNGAAIGVNAVPVTYTPKSKTSGRGSGNQAVDFWVKNNAAVNDQVESRVTEEAQNWLDANPGASSQQINQQKLGIQK